MNSEQSLALTTLLYARDSIDSQLGQIEQLLQNKFPKEYDAAYQHWIPQIRTALYNDTRWLPRGQLTLQDTIDHIKDTSVSGGGVSKFIR
jgi:hypothetical protein